MNDFDNETAKVILRKYYALKNDNERLRERILTLEDEVKVLQRFISKNRYNTNER